jgi:hypothetical protein
MGHLPLIMGVIPGKPGLLPLISVTRELERKYETERGNIYALSTVRGYVLLLIAALLFLFPASEWSTSSNNLSVPGVKGGVVNTSETNAARVGAEIL